MHCVVEMARPKRVVMIMVIVLRSSRLNLHVGKIRVIRLTRLTMILWPYVYEPRTTTAPRKPRIHIRTSVFAPNSSPEFQIAKMVE